MMKTVAWIFLAFNYFSTVCSHPFEVVEVKMNHSFTL